MYFKCCWLRSLWIPLAPVGENRQDEPTSSLLAPLVKRWRAFLQTSGYVFLGGKEHPGRYLHIGLVDNSSVHSCKIRYFIKCRSLARLVSFHVFSKLPRYCCLDTDHTTHALTRSRSSSLLAFHLDVDNIPTPFFFDTVVDF